MFRIALLLTLITAPAFAQQRTVRVLVGFNAAVNAQALAAVESYGGEVTRQFSIVNAVAATVPEEAIEQLRQHPLVSVVELDGEVHINDEELDAAWGVKRIGGGVVHDGGNKGAGVKVAVVDTGVDYTHPELANRYRGGFDCINNDNDPMDDHYHGTHVAGTVLAEDDDAGVVGVAPEAELYGVKVLNAQGSGQWSHVVCGIEWVVANGIQVTNNSYGGSTYSSIVDAAFQAAWNAGVISVASAGNSGCCDRVGYPGKLATVIATAATDSQDQRAGFSSTGLEVEISAPGVGVLSAQLGGGYKTLSGTSMASPHVAGTAALVIAANPGATNQDVRDRLTLTADDLGTPDRDKEYGFGLVNAPAAVGPFDRAPVITITSPADGARFEPGTVVSFAGSAQDEEDGDLTQNLEWVSNFDGPIGVGGSFEFALTNGLHAITASVADSTGKLGVKKISVRMAPPNVAPTVTMLFPREGERLDSDVIYTFSATATDPEDGDVSASIFWLLDQHTNLGKGKDIKVQLPPGSYEVSAWAQDSESSFGMAAANVVVALPPLVIESIDYGWFGGANGVKHFDVTVTLNDKKNGIILLGTLTSETGQQIDVGAATKNGVATIRTRSLAAMCYALTITAIEGSERQWDGTTPPNEGCPAPRRTR